MRCLRKLRCFSTPHAWFTAVLIAPKTPSDAQMSARPPAAPICKPRLPEHVDLRRDELEARGEVPEDEIQHLARATLRRS